MTLGGAVTVRTKFARHILYYVFNIEPALRNPLKIAIASTEESNENPFVPDYLDKLMAISALHETHYCPTCIEGIYCLACQLFFKI
jgi:hypothetical protein